MKVVCCDTARCLCWITLYYHSSCLHLLSIIWGSDSKLWWIYTSSTGKVKSYKGQREIYLFPTLPSTSLNCLRSNWTFFVLQLVRSWSMRSPTGKMSYKFLGLPVPTKCTLFHVFYMQGRGVLVNGFQRSLHCQIKQKYSFSVHLYS